MGGSASPDGLRCRSRSHLRSLSWCMEGDRPEEQFSLHFVSVVATLQSLNHLAAASSESFKIHKFRAALEDDDQLASSLYICCC